VKTREGWKPIEEIQSEDFVWTHPESLQRVIGLQHRPHVGRLIGIRLTENSNMVWVTPDQHFLAPSPQAERGLGGEGATPTYPTPNPSPRAGRGKTARIHDNLGGVSSLLPQLAQQLRKDATSAEKLLWECVRGRRMCGAKFRRQHPLGNHYIADFYCPEKYLAIELDGSVHNSQQARWSDGIRHRQLSVAGVKVLRFSNERIFSDLKGVLLEISQYLALGSSDSNEQTPEEHVWRRAEELVVGDLLIVSEQGRVQSIEEVDHIIVNEPVYDLIIECNYSFITEAGVVQSLASHS
jgi:very-short-patch-repair endonuclease